MYFDFFGPNLPEKEFRVGVRVFILKTKLEYDNKCQFSSKTNNFDFLGPNLPKNGF